MLIDTGNLQKKSAIYFENHNSLIALRTVSERTVKLNYRVASLPKMIISIIKVQDKMVKFVQEKVNGFNFEYHQIGLSINLFCN